MSNFTYEELTIILQGLSVWTADYNFNPTRYKEIISVFEKVAAMRKEVANK